MQEPKPVQKCLKMPTVGAEANYREANSKKVADDPQKGSESVDPTIFTNAQRENLFAYNLAPLHIQ